MPGGKEIQVKRVDHPLRKIFSEDNDAENFRLFDDQGKLLAIARMYQESTDFHLKHRW